MAFAGRFIACQLSVFLPFSSLEGTNMAEMDASPHHLYLHACNLQPGHYQSTEPRRQCPDRGGDVVETLLNLSQVRFARAEM